MGRKLIFESIKSRISRVDSTHYKLVLRKEVPQIIAVKVLKNECPTPCDINRFYNEYEILKDITHPQVRKVYVKSKHQNQHTIFLEWVEGKSIKEFGKVTDVHKFVSIAVQIVSALEAIHTHRIVHRDISSDNVIVNTTTNDVKLIDFDMSKRIEAGEHDLGTTQSLEGTLHFISPEQTGNLDRPVDYRSDLYSLGVVFYYMLAGRLPFMSSDHREVVRMHLHEHATPVCEVDSNIPTPLSNLVKKLMSKLPEDRYQSAGGILFDLRRMLAQIKTHGKIKTDFFIAKRDFLGRLQISQELYGRRNEMRTLSEAFDNVDHSDAEVVLIAGSAGTGKSSLVNKFAKRVTDQGGYFIKGKYNCLQKDEPYSAIVQAFNSFFGMLQREDQSKIDRIRTLLQDTVGADKKLLTEMMPNLRFLLDDQTDLQEIGFIDIHGQIDMREIGMIETKYRFNSTFSKLVDTLGELDQPNLFFLDDLQWADSASLGLLSSIIFGKVRNLLLVFAYRNDEGIMPSREAMRMFEKIQGSERVNVRNIEVRSLTSEDTVNLVADSLENGTTRPDEVYGLAEVVYQKTHGNPLLVGQFMRSLADQNLLYFCNDTFRWKWEMEKINEKKVFHSVAELYIDKIMQLPDDIRHTLDMASLIGNHFDLPTLELITDKPGLYDTLMSLTTEGILTAASNGKMEFCFSHDSIHQAAYSLLCSRDNEFSMHLEVGRLLKSKLNDSKLEEMTFVVVNHFNSGLDMIQDENERADVALLNMKAAIKARRSSAFEKALSYAKSGIKILTENYWKENYRLSLELFTLAAQMAHSNGYDDKAETYIQEVLNNARSFLDKVEVFGLKINLLVGQDRRNEAIEYGLWVLEQCGESIPVKPSKIYIAYNFLKTRMLFRKKQGEAILYTVHMSNPLIVAKMKIMGSLLAPSFSVNTSVTRILVLKQVQLTLEYGFSKYSTFGIAMYGQILLQEYGDAKEATRYGELALKLYERSQAKELLSATYILVYAFIFSSTKHLKSECVPQLQKAAKFGQVYDENRCGYVADVLSISFMFAGGCKLRNVDEATERCNENARRYKQQSIVHILKPMRQCIQNLKSDKTSKDPKILEGEIIAAGETQELFEINRFSAMQYYGISSILAYLFHDYSLATEMFNKGKAFGSMCMYGKNHMRWIETLILLANARQTRNNKNLIKEAKVSLKHLEEASKNGPENFESKVHLVLAELAFCEGSSSNATEHYDQAIFLAEKSENLMEEALACERALIYCVETVDMVYAPRYYRRACQVYREWGGVAKVQHLVALYGNQMSMHNKGSRKKRRETW